MVRVKCVATNPILSGAVRTPAFPGRLIARSETCHRMSGFCRASLLSCLMKQGEPHRVSFMCVHWRPVVLNACEAVAGAQELFPRKSPPMQAPFDKSHMSTAMDPGHVRILHASSCRTTAVLVCSQMKRRRQIVVVVCTRQPGFVGNSGNQTR